MRIRPKPLVVFNRKSGRGGRSGWVLVREELRDWKHVSSKEHVTSFRHALVEFDRDDAGTSIPKEQQHAAILASGLPVSALIDSGIQPPMILGQLRAATIRLRPDSRVKNGLEAVFRTDGAIKSSAGTPQYLLECLVVELCAR